MSQRDNVIAEIDSRLAMTAWRKDRFGHWKLGERRFKIGRGTVRYERLSETGTWCMLCSWFYGKFDWERFEHWRVRAERVAGVTSESTAPAEAPAPAPSTSVMTVTMTENDAKDGVELKFSEKPAKGVRESLMAHGFRFSTRQQLWYARRSPGRLEFARSLASRAGAVPQEAIA